MWPPAHPRWKQFPHTKRTSLENSNHHPLLPQEQWLVSKYYQFIIPFLFISISTGERMIRHISATTTTSDTNPIQKNIGWKVGNHEVSSVSPLGGLQSDSNSNVFSDMLKKIRIIHEKCPKCLLLHWQKIAGRVRELHRVAPSRHRRQQSSPAMENDLEDFKEVFVRVAQLENHQCIRQN